MIAQYGRIQSVPGPLVEGAPITVTIQHGGEECTFVDCYLSRESYAWAFVTAGLHSLTWRQPQVSPADLEGDGQAYWQSFLDYPTFVVLEARK